MMTEFTEEKLAELKAVAERATEPDYYVCDCTTLCGGVCPNPKPIYRSIDNEAVLALIAALEAVCGMHQKREADAVTGDCATEDCEHEEVCPTQLFDVCIACWNLCEEADPYFGERGITPVLWPCSTIRAIESALGDDEGGQNDD